MEKFVSWIENNYFLNVIQKAGHAMGSFNPVIVLFALILSLAHGLYGIEMRLDLWFVFVVVYSFGYTFMVIYSMTNQDISKSLWLGFLAVIPFLIHKTVPAFLPILSIATAFLFTYLDRRITRISIDIKAVHKAINNTLSSLLHVTLMVLSSFLFAMFYMMNHALFSGIIHGLLMIFSNIVFIMVSVFMVTLLWSKGFHGANLMGKTLSLFYMQMLIANITGYLSTGSILYMGQETFIQWAVLIGGSGCTLGLSFAMKFLAKSNALKSIGQHGFVSGLFNINEEVLFGIPIVENKHYAFPFFVAPLVNVGVAYLAIINGWVNYPLLPVSWIMPNPVGFFVSTLFDWRSIVLSLVLIFVSFVVYLPFFLADDRKRLETARH
ncbi:MAG: PTS sugar transporter subunit IIC [Erysipelothrix sp.]|nr:PTS sugar transporter subunit IIC [Erysipelothrix sp.]